MRIWKIAAQTNNSRIENRLRIVNYGSDRLFRSLVCDSIRANATMRIRWHGRRYWRRAVLYSAQESNRRLRLSNAAKTTVGSFPKGKLKPKENAVSAARREASEETGHDVDVREFLGVISYWTSGRPKIVHFWRMQAADAPGRTLTSDVKAMKWLGLASAIERLSTPHEQAFLQHVGRHAVELTEPERRKARSTKSIA